METKRIDFIDTAKGFCIMLVVLTHVLDDCYAIDHPLKLQLEPIRMPLYFILSGLFFKSYDGFWDFCLRKINKILVPYVFFFAIFVAVSFFSNLLGPAFNDWHGPLWFLLCLFEMNLIFCALRIAIKNDYVLIAACLSLGVAFSFFGRLPLRLGTAFSCLPFFVFGYFLRNKTTFLTDKTPWYTTLVVVIATAILTTIWGDMCWYLNNDFHMNIFALYLCGMVGTIAVLMLSKHIKKIPFVSFVGRYSLIILVCHYAVMKLSAGLFDFPNVSLYLRALMHYIFIMGTSALLIFPMKRFLPWFVAQKDLFRTRKQLHPTV